MLRWILDWNTISPLLFLRQLRDYAHWFKNSDHRLGSIRTFNAMHHRIDNVVQAICILHQSKTVIEAGMAPSKVEKYTPFIKCCSTNLFDLFSTWDKIGFGYELADTIHLYIASLVAKRCQTSNPCLTCLFLILVVFMVLILFWVQWWNVFFDANLSKC